MPVLESTDKAAPRSALRYRPLDDSSKRSIVTDAAHPIARRASRVRPPVADDDLITEWQRGDAEEPAHTTAPQRKTNPPVRQVTTRAQKQPTATALAATRSSGRARLHPLLLLGLGMLAMLALWVLVSAGLNWWNTTLDYLHYGYPRTFQTDAVVGHNDSATTPSHFLAINLHGRIEIIEFPGGDGAHARMYLGPQLFGSDADKTPVTLQFADVNGDHRPDMLVFFQSSWIVFINDQGTFRSPTSQERQDAVQYLASHGQS